MALVDASRIRVEIVVSVAPRTVQRVMIELAHGASLRDAVEASGLMGQIEGLDAAGLAAGVWSPACGGARSGLVRCSVMEIAWSWCDS